MSITITHTRDFPEAWGYVLANDTYLSGWGPAFWKTNVVVLPVRDHKEAETVAENARARTDMVRVRIVTRRPTMRPDRLYSLMERDEASRWYDCGGFVR